MAKIKVLDDKTINKIAAGEVVERPVSVVKELVENSIDAYASNIIVEIKKGGTSYIRVTDNGLGIEKEDIRNAFLRHSTSKISKVEDLGSILTLGFRGEALASIAAVSRIEILSKTRISDMGQKLIIHGGDVREEIEIGTANGTTIIIRDLFFNIPVRKGFLKSEISEAMAINEFIYKLAISNPQVSFTYIKDGKIELKTPGRGTLEETVYSVLGGDFINQTFPVSYKKKGIEIKGYISNLKYVRGNRSDQYIFINGRTIKSTLISKAVEEIYKEKITVGKFPRFVLFIDVDPEEVDVNMHPSKMEVKFKKEKEIERAVKEAVSERLHKENLIPEVKIIQQEDSVKPETKKIEEYENIPVFSLLDEKAVFRKGKEESGNIFIHEPEEKIREISPREELNIPDKIEIVKPKEIEKQPADISKNIRVVGVIFNTYILGEDRVSDEFIMIDQHAAHERVLYEELKEKYRKREIYSQELIGAAPVELNLNDMIKLEKNKEMLNTLGFSFEEFGENTIRINSIPMIFGNPDTEQLLLDILDVIDIDDDSSQNIYDRKLDKIIKQACTAAVKGGDRITNIEIDALIEKLFKTENPYTCPHGRPITIRTSRRELEKSFDRIQN